MPEMRDDFNDYSSDPSAQKSVTDWLMRVIARKEDAVLHHDEAPKKKATDSETATAVQDSTATATTVNGSNGAHAPQNGHPPTNAASQNGHALVAPPLNGHSYSAPLQDAPATQAQNGYAPQAGFQNGHEPASPSQNGHSYGAPSLDTHATPSQNGHAASPIIDVFGDVFSPPSQNGNGFAAGLDGHSNGALKEGYEFSADDLCGPPAFGPVPKIHREEITADDLCWVPKPQVTESYRNGNGHHEPVAATPEPIIAAPSAEFLEQLIGGPAVFEPQVVVPEQSAVEEPVEIPQAPGADWHDPFAATPLVSEPERQTIDAAAEVPAAPEEAVIEAQPKTTPEQWLEQMMSMAKPTPEPQTSEAQPSVTAEVVPLAETAVAEPSVPAPALVEAVSAEPMAVEPMIAEPSTAEPSVAPDFYEPIKADTQQPEVILPEPQVIDAPMSAAAEVVPAAEADAAPEIAVSPEVAAEPESTGTEPAKPEVISAAQTVVEAPAQTEQSAAAGEQSTNLVPVERRKRKRPSVSIADICRDWVVEEMEANGGVAEAEEYEEDDDFPSQEDTIVQTPESVFAHEGIWGNTGTPGMTGENGQQSAIPEIEGAGAKGQARSGNRDSSGMKALLRLGTLLPWLAREMEAGNDQNAALTQEVRHEVSGMRLVQYEIRSTVHDHSLQLKRVEEQLTRVRESIQAETSGTEELVETVKSTTKAISFMGIGIISVLVVLLGMMVFLIMHSR